MKGRVDGEVGTPTETRLKVMPSLTTIYGKTAASQEANSSGLYIK